VGVPFVAADLVGRAGREPDDVERVEADLGGADGALVLAAHVDRDRPDRLFAGPELVEELGQGGAVAPRPAPHDRARAVVGNRGQVALPAAVADLVDADRDEPVEAAFVEVVGGDALHDPPDGVPADPEQPRDRGLGHLLRQPRDDVLEVARVMGARPGPRHRLHAHCAGLTAQQPQLALDHAAVGAEVEVAPALDATVVNLELPAGLPAARADAQAPAQPDGHDHPLSTEADIDDGRPGEPEQPLERGADAHVALLAEPLTFDSQQPPGEGGGASLAICATSAKFLSPQTRRKRAPNAAIQAAPSPTNRQETP
jgi:hypothetical protein